jgi:hypothetical protein
MPILITNKRGKKEDGTSRHNVTGISTQASSLLTNGKLHSSPPTHNLQNQHLSYSLSHLSEVDLSLVSERCGIHLREEM